MIMALHYKPGPITPLTFLLSYLIFPPPAHQHRFSSEPKYHAGALLLSLQTPLFHNSLLGNTFTTQTPNNNRDGDNNQHKASSGSFLSLPPSRAQPSLCLPPSSQSQLIPTQKTRTHQHMTQSTAISARCPVGERSCASGLCSRSVAQLRLTAHSHTAPAWTKHNFLRRPDFLAGHPMF